HFQNSGAPRRGSGRKRRRVTARLEKLTRLDALLPREGIEITKHDCRQRCRFGLCGNRLELRELPIYRRVRIDVRVENPNVLCPNLDRRGNRESWTPLTLLPWQIDPRHVC